jgi:hypothetical protein
MAETKYTVRDVAMDLRTVLLLLIAYIGGTSASWANADTDRALNDVTWAL